MGLDAETVGRRRGDPIEDGFDGEDFDPGQELLSLIGGEGVEDSSWHRFGWFGLRGGFLFFYCVFTVFTVFSPILTGVSTVSGLLCFTVFLVCSAVFGLCLLCFDFQGGSPGMGTTNGPSVAKPLEGRRE